MARFRVIFTKRMMLEIEAEDVKDASERASVMEDEYIEQNGVDIGAYPWELDEVCQIPEEKE